MYSTNYYFMLVVATAIDCSKSASFSGPAPEQAARRRSKREKKEELAAS